MTCSLPASADPSPLRLSPDPSAAHDARTWVAGTLSGWPEESVETARLLVSELVSNAVLHARTAIVVACRLDGARARFGVTDGQRGGPISKRFALDSPTGRGMRLVASLAEEWGVQRGPRGKTVWFVVSPETRVGPAIDFAAVAVELAADLQEIGATATPQREQPGTPDGGPGDQPAADREPDTFDVVALELPLDVYLEAEQHNDAVVRELTLIVQSAQSESGLEVPRRLLDLATEVRGAFSPASDGLRAQVEEAILRGQSAVDIHMAVPRQGWEALLRLVDWLDEVDRYCEDGDLLTLASSPRLRRFRAWYGQQVAGQMRGKPPTPWECTPGA